MATSGSASGTTASSALTRLVDLFLRGDVAVLSGLVSLLLGAAALWLTPREEEPQIVVPMADIFVNAPGLSAAEVERQVTDRLEKLLYQIDGVEYVYSMSKPGQSVVTVRYYVGEDREDSLLKLYNKLYSSTDQVPPSVTSWYVKPVEIDDVPIVIATLWSTRPQQYGDHELRRIAEQLQHALQAIPDTNRVQVVGGRPRRIRIELDPQRLAAHGSSPQQVAEALRLENVHIRCGHFDQQDQQILVEAGLHFQSVEELQDLVVQVAGDRPVYLRNVATITDGPAEVDSYSWIGFGAADAEGGGREGLYPAVHLAVAKRKGANAVRIARAVESRLHELAPTHLPAGVEFRVTRDQGETANEKVNELVESLVVAVITVVGLIGLVIGWRPALVIATAIPVCYSLTLFVNLLTGYTINRVTLFALILALGLLVDDPITDVENIARYFAMRILPRRESVLQAVQEVRVALLMSTLAIIVSFLPLAFITGMMGPYMAPMALNVPLTVTLSTFVAFFMTPWMAMVMLGGPGEVSVAERPAYDLTTRPLYRASRAVLQPILASRGLCWTVLGGIFLLLLAALVLPVMRLVPVKMLPYDNKNEFQILIDMPEGTTLERTNAVAVRIAQYVSGMSEVVDYQLFVGEPSPMDFNGMVRHYFLRRAPHLADIRVNLLPKESRAQQSHEILLRVREPLEGLARSLGAEIKLIEVPPGPPVLSTITAEVYGPDAAGYDELIAAGRRVADRLDHEPGVVDLDSSAESDQVRWVFVTDKAKAALSGISTQAIGETVSIAVGGSRPSVLHLPDEVDPLWIELRMPRAGRSSIGDLSSLYVRGEDGQRVQLASLGAFQEQLEDKTIYHKNLRRVVYVFAEVVGRPPADAVVDVMWDQRRQDAADSREVSDRSPAERTWLRPGGDRPWSLPAGFAVEWAGEGEWKITLDVFRDLGLAFAAALLGIFVILMFQTRSRVLPILIMLAIPLTMIGILPGFWLLNSAVGGEIGGYANSVYFTATAMIGMIALAGIVVRNSVVLIDFIHLAQREGFALEEAIIRSVAVRTRPILLTAGTTLLANWVITLDPVFSGLAWAIIFGILTSTLFTLIVIPVVYWLIYGGAAGADSEWKSPGQS